VQGFDFKRQSMVFWILSKWHISEKLLNLGYK
jgi:hypothetical protein